MRKLVFWVILFIISYGLVELCSYGGLNLLPKYRDISFQPDDLLSQKQIDSIKRIIAQKTNYTVFSSTLGWSIKQNGYSKLYKSNSQGLRSNREYELTPPHGIFRITTFGDSFTHCDDVNNNETWQAIIESYQSNLEVLNFGVPGYGLDQAYLRYLEDGSQYESHITLIGFMSENIYRNVNTFRPFYYKTTGIPLAKPRFLIDNNELSFIPNYFNEVNEYNSLLNTPKEVLYELGINDYYFDKKYRSFNKKYLYSDLDGSPTVQFAIILQNLIRKKIHKKDTGIVTDNYYNKKSEAFIITKRIFDKFYNEVIENNSIPIIVIFPDKNDIARFQRDKTKKYAPLLSYFDSMDYKYIDLLDVLKNADIEELFVTTHYSPDGNRFIAKNIYNSLADLLQKNK